MQNLRQQNMQLKNKMSQLTMALDKAIVTRNDKHLTSSPDKRAPANFSKPQGFREDQQFEQVRKSIPTGGGNGELNKQMDVNRRLNDLLNQKDEEIVQLNT